MKHVDHREYEYDIVIHHPLKMRVPIEARCPTQGLRVPVAITL